MASDQTTRGGRRPGAGRKPGQGTGANPEVRERVIPDLAAYCKAKQATEPGYLARLLRAEQAKESQMIGVVQLENGNWGVIGSECDEDDAWGEYPDAATAAKAREALEASDWDANTIRGLQVRAIQN